MNATVAPDQSSAIASFVANLTYEDLPDTAVRTAERCILDTVGVTLAGVDTEAADRARRAVVGWGGGGEAHVWGTDLGASLADAAFLNGVAGHALDFDDVSLRTMDGHPSVTMVAPILETARAVDASPRAAVTAFVAGFETQRYVAAPICPGHYERGWHATGTIGTFGATAAVASVLGLSAEEIRRAMNIAASMPSGLKRNFGSMTKSMHVGEAARSGVAAATLAAEGFTADEAALSGDHGFNDLYSGGDGVTDAADTSIGDELALCEQGVDVKKYPCCYYSHAAIAATVDLAREHDISPDSVEKVSVRSSQGAADALLHEDPRTGLEAKFSMPYLVATALVTRRVGLAAFEAPSLGDENVRGLLGRISLVVDESLPYESNAASVRVQTDSETYLETYEQPPGTHDDPLSEAELGEKFRMCAERSIAASAADDLLERLRTLREQSSVSVALAPI